MHVEAQLREPRRDRGRHRGFADTAFPEHHDETVAGGRDFVHEIGERPASLSGQQWFDRLSNAYATDYMALSGGRGAFKLTPEELEAARNASLQ